MVWSGAWPTLPMQTARNRLEDLSQRLSNSSGDPDTVADLSRFLVVRSTGYVEYTCETCIRHFAETHAHPAVARHVVSGLFRGRNPKPDVLLDRVGSLDRSWAQLLEEYLNADDGKVRRELEFMIDRRNKIAHGESESVHRRKALDLAGVALGLGDCLTVIMDPR